MKPTINIKYGKLIDPFFKDSVSVNYPDYKFPSKEKVLEKVELFRKVWDREGVFFIEEMSKLGLEFKRNIIDCFIVSATPRDMSAPLIIRSRYDEVEFMDMMYHELLHTLMSDSRIPKYSKDDMSDTVINHIDLFAILNLFYSDVLKDEKRLSLVKKQADGSKNIEYRKTWDLVEKIGYKKIIKNLKKEKKNLSDYNLTSSE